MSARRKYAAVALATLFLVAMPLSTLGQQNRPLEITQGPNVEHVTSNSAVIAWTTNTGGSSVIHYGSNPRSLNQVAQAPYDSAENREGATHRVTLRNLRPDTTYYFVVASGQGQGTGTQALGAVQSFTTQGEGRTDRDDYRRDDYRRDRADRDYGRDRDDRAYGRERGDRRDRGRDRYDRPDYSRDRSARSDEEREEAQPVHILDGPRVEEVGDTWAVVSWTTNVSSSSVVHYGTDRNNLGNTAQSPYADREGARAQSHRVRLENLRPDTTYFFIVDSGQGEGTGTEAMSRIRQFRTR